MKSSKAFRVLNNFKELLEIEESINSLLKQLASGLGLNSF